MIFLLGLTKTYLALGAIAACAFLLIGLERLEPSARHSHAFRILLVPGLVLLWPMVLWRWRKGERPLLVAKLRAQHKAHVIIWLFLAIAVPLLFAAALWHHPAIQGAPVQLSLPNGKVAP